MDCRIGGITFSSNFDSGNLFRVEKVSQDGEDQSQSSSSSKQNSLSKGINLSNNNTNGNHGITEIRVDYDFRIWTRPDCAGTPFENGNRTWFHFSVRGYQSGRLVRFRIMNMNKQSKIYSQGYAPLFRVINASHSNSRWQRIKDKPCWDTSNGQFSLTFIHRFVDSRNSTTFFAFAFPWTYEQSQNQLDHLDSIFSQQKSAEFFQNLRLVPEIKTSTRPKSPPVAAKQLDSNRSEDLLKVVYFHRELLCYSLEGRRIDLLTITDWSGCVGEREDKFDPLLFPLDSEERPWKFQDKKVVFITARVHPGETPSSHVFNGLLELLLRCKDARASELRKRYVFKLIPMLNPDGVYRGHYRTDTRGVNLNRVYLEPDFLYYPSVYAAKALMVYYHTNYGTTMPYAPFLDNLLKPPPIRCQIKDSPPRCNSSSNKNPWPEADVDLESIHKLAVHHLTQRSPSQYADECFETAIKLDPFDMSLDASSSSSDIAEIRSSISEHKRKLRCAKSSTPRRHKSFPCMDPFILPEKALIHRSTLDFESIMDSSVVKQTVLQDWAPKVIPLTLVSGDHRVESNIRSELFEDLRDLCGLPNTELRRSKSNTKSKSSLLGRPSRLKSLHSREKPNCLTAVFKTKRRSASLKTDFLPNFFTKFQRASTDLMTRSLICGGRPHSKSRDSTGSDRGRSIRRSQSGKSVQNELQENPMGRAQTRGPLVMKCPESQMENPNNSLGEFKPILSAAAMISQLYQDNSNAIEESDPRADDTRVEWKLSDEGFRLTNRDSDDPEVGNEASDEDDGLPHPELGQTVHVIEEDISLNPQFVRLLDQVQEWVKNGSKFGPVSDRKSDQPTAFPNLERSAGSGSSPKSQTELVNRIKDQLDLLRRGTHLADPGLKNLPGSSGLKFYFDLHGHCSKRGCFLYGNWLESEDDMVNNVLYALLVGVHSASFDFNACNFSVRNMYQRDRYGSLTKEGSGRVAIWKHLGLVNSYTLECNYNSGTMPSRLARHFANINWEGSDRLTPPGTFIGPRWTDIAGSIGVQMLENPSGTPVPPGNTSGYYHGRIPYGTEVLRFTPCHYEEVGRALLFSILDLNQANPWPRISNLGGPNAVPGVGVIISSGTMPEFRSFGALKEWTRKYIRNLIATNGTPTSGHQHHHHHHPTQQPVKSRRSNLSKQGWYTKPGSGLNTPILYLTDMNELSKSRSGAHSFSCTDFKPPVPDSPDIPFSLSPLSPVTDSKLEPLLSPDPTCVAALKACSFRQPRAGIQTDAGQSHRLDLPNSRTSEIGTRLDQSKTSNALPQMCQDAGTSNQNSVALVPKASDIHLTNKITSTDTRNSNSQEPFKTSIKKSNSTASPNSSMPKSAHPLPKDKASGALIRNKFLSLNRTPNQGDHLATTKSRSLTDPSQISNGHSADFGKSLARNRKFVSVPYSMSTSVETTRKSPNWGPVCVKLSCSNQYDTPKPRSSEATSITISEDDMSHMTISTAAKTHSQSHRQRSKTLRIFKHSTSSDESHIRPDKKPYCSLPGVRLGIAKSGSKHRRHSTVSKFSNIQPDIVGFVKPNRNPNSGASSDDKSVLTSQSGKLAYSGVPTSRRLFSLLEINSKTNPSSARQAFQHGLARARSNRSTSPNKILEPLDLCIPNHVLRRKWNVANRLDQITNTNNAFLWDLTSSGRKGFACLSARTSQ